MSGPGSVVILGRSYIVYRMQLLSRFGIAFASLVITIVSALSILPAPLAQAAPSGRVINGTDASVGAPGVHAVVAVGTAGAPSAWDAAECGGTLIAPTLVVTARHCVESPPFVSDARRLIVFRGTGPALELPQRGWAGVDQVPVASIHRSPGAPDPAFNRGGDIAILRLRAPLATAAPIAYAGAAHTAWAAPRTSGVVLYGWGATIDYDERRRAEATGYPTRLQTASFPIVSTSTCMRGAQFPKVTAQYLCAGRPGSPGVGTSSCYGDSGGPLLARDPAAAGADADVEFRLVGVVSHGDADRCAGAYTRYVRVDRWASWIDGYVARAASEARDSSAAPRIASTTLAPNRRLRVSIEPSADVPAPARIALRLAKSGATTMLEIGTVAPAGGVISPPPSRNGALQLVAVAIDAAGNEGIASTRRPIAVPVDRTAPTIERATARALGGGRWLVSWSRPTDDDRVVNVEVERRRAGMSRWISDRDVSCAACWTSTSAQIARTSQHDSLGGRWEFRVTATDRAGNRGRPVRAAAQ